MSGKPRVLDLLAPLASIAVFSLLLVTGVTAEIGDRIYDLFSRIRPAAPAVREVLLVDVDDAAVAAGGAWPWNRGVLADGLVAMTEMEAEAAVFTIPFPRRSAPGIDASALQGGIPDAFDREFSRIEDNIQSLFDAIRRGSVPPKDSQRYVSELIGLVASGKARLQDEVTGIERDDDLRFGQAAQFFGRTFLPLELIPAPDPAVARDLEERAVRTMALSGVAAVRDRSLRAQAIRPPVLPVLRGAHGGGFADPAPDADGVYRRAAPTAVYEGSHFAQVAIAAALDRLGDPPLELSEGGIEIRGTVPLSIPLGRDGRMLIDWPRAADGDGLRHLSWAGFLRQGRLEGDLLSALRDMEHSGYLSYHRSESSLLDLEQYADNLLEEMLAGGSTERIPEWRAARERFFDAAKGFLEGDAEARIVADIDKALSSQKLSDEERRGIRDVRDRVPMAFTYARGTFSDLMKERAALRESLRGALCIVSLAASPQADAGRTPVGRAASAGLASAALANAVLSGRFLREVPSRVLIALAAACSLLAAAAAFRMGPLGCTLTAAGFAAAVPALLGCLFAFSGIFADPLAPAGSAACTAAAMAVLKARRGRREDRARTRPGRLPAEARRPAIAAAEASVTVLEAEWKAPRFLPGTTDAKTVLEQGGRTAAALHGAVLRGGGSLSRSGIGSLAAVFGAAADRGDHARRACQAALSMKAGAGKPVEGLRIGIDTGVCAVGSLGTPGCADLAAVGEPSELAGRLASLNLRCGTAILVTAPVMEAAGDGLAFRSMHRVRIAGSRRAIRLYEPLGEIGRVEGKVLDVMDLFREGLARLEGSDWKKAEEAFRGVLAALPGDGPAAFFIERCHELAAHPPGARWDGVFTLPAR